MFKQHATTDKLERKKERKKKKNIYPFGTTVVENISMRN